MLFTTNAKNWDSFKNRISFTEFLQLMRELAIINIFINFKFVAKELILPAYIFPNKKTIKYDDE